MRRTTWQLPFLALVGACASAANHIGGQDVAIGVRNRSTRAVEVRVCADDCSAYRTIGGGRRASFSFPARRNTRAVVTAKRGDRIVGEKPVDFAPGDRIEVSFDVP